MLEEILRFLENEECETNQYLMEMKELFRGHEVKAWKGVDFSTMKYKELKKYWL